jgi:hypothetical protein
VALSSSARSAGFTQAILLAEVLRPRIHSGGQQAAVMR